ncbi:MAG: hypothetical protein HOP29_02330 [Phycisphaerales bacterium]|nr:hypothetical protein [Phycisphaerales bacterium]
MKRKRAAAWLGMAAPAVWCGCGVIDFRRDVFAGQPLNADGEPIYVDDLRAITQDADLSDDEMVDALRQLGIENEALIDAIIADGLAP